MDNLIKVSPAELPHFMELSFESNLVPMIWGSPGTGKSASARAFAKKHNLKFLDVRLVVHDPTDFSGIPFKAEGENRATHLPFDMVPLEGLDEVPEGYSGWLLFLDELPQAPKETKLAAFKLTLEREIGKYAIHKKCLIACAGNLITDRSGAEALPKALSARLHHMWLVSDAETWLDNVAAPFGYDKRVIGFIGRYPGELYKFDPEDDEALTFACNRTWEFVSNACKTLEKRNIPINTAYLNFYTGIIGSGVAAKFLSFCKIYEQVPDPSQIIADPDNTPVPTDQSLQWATVTSLIDHIKDQKTCDKIITYIMRFPITMQVVFVNMSIKRTPYVVSSTGTAKLLTNTGKTLAELK